MQRWKITLQYDGSYYHGWQSQDDLHCVQNALEKALFRLCQTQIRVHVAGRTDTGVHALGQVIHADIPRILSAKRMRLALQAQLAKEAVAITDCIVVSQDFHARFSAQMRHYRYLIAQCPTPPPLLHSRVWWQARKLDIDAIRQAAQQLEGHHDFTSFRAAGCQANSPFRSIKTINIKQSQLLDTPIIECAFSARSFLYHQVRNMVGTLSDIGLGRRPTNEVNRLLLCKDRTQAAATAPPHGLYFSGVDY